MIYLDNAATTPLKKEVLRDMLPYLESFYYNPSSIYSAAQNVQADISAAREQVATIINVHPKEVYFTSSGTEAINWALKGAARTMKRRGKTGIIISAIEHHAVLHCADSLKREGFEVTLLPVNEYGKVSVDSLSEAINDNTGLCSIMLANNEIGTIQDIKELAAVAKERGVVFHTDAVQALGSIPVDVEELGVDMLNLSAHKFGGPKGVGVLYIRKGLSVESLIDGGGQEQSRRAGTENVAGIIGLSSALKLATDTMPERRSYIESLRDKLQTELATIKKVRFNGDPNSRLPGILSVSFEGIEGEGILLFLDMQGIAASSGSACASGSLDPSHVILATGLSHGIAQGTIRFSLSADNTEQEIETTVVAIKSIVERLRAMSPVWKD